MSLPASLCPIGADLSRTTTRQHRKVSDPGRCPEDQGVRGLPPKSHAAATLSIPTILCVLKNGAPHYRSGSAAGGERRPDRAYSETTAAADHAVTEHLQDGLTHKNAGIPPMEVR